MEQDKRRGVTTTCYDLNQLVVSFNSHAVLESSSEVPFMPEEEFLN
jgi:hypothetical protein